MVAKYRCASRVSDYTCTAMDSNDESASTPFPDVLKQEAQLSDFLEDDGRWTDIYLSEGATEGLTMHAAFTPVAIRGAILERPEWDSGIGGGGPGFTQHGDGRIEYSRHCCRHEDVLPIVIKHSNHGIGAPILPEIVEEFRHLMEFRPNTEHTEYYKLTPDGSLEPAAQVSDTSVRIRTPYLRQYQAARQLDLVRYMESQVREPGDHTAGFKAVYGDNHHEIIGSNCRFRMWSAERGGRQGSTVTILMGKKVIRLFAF